MSDLFDGSVTGSIQGGDTQANVTANGSCVNGAPVGNISGSITTFTGSDTTTFSFQSSTPFIVATSKTDTSVEGLYFVFKHVKLKRDGYYYCDNCTAVVTAGTTSSIATVGWGGSITIICPNGKKLGVFGRWTGSLNVDNVVLCKPLQ